jgi:hypothetical protein
MSVLKSVILILAVSVMSFFIVHAILARLWHNRAGQVVALTAVVVTFIPTLVVALVCIRPVTGVLSFWAYLILVYTTLGYTYFHFFNTSETARRIRLIHEIDLAGGLTKEQIKTLYRTEDILLLRLQRLVRLGQLRYVDGLYSISNDTLYIAARITEAWQQLLGFKKRG